MDGFVWFLVMVGVVVAFVGMVRKSRREAQERRELEDRTTRLAQGVATPARRSPAPAAKPSRAMRTGWSLGEVAFTYEDSAGDVTFRTVTLHSVTATHLKGECHDRGAERTFRVDRIIGDVVDLETGELLRPRSLARHFG
jgi:predicted DNA-binding transcriptional regulator YafY